MPAEPNLILRLIGFEIGGEFFEIGDGQIVTRHQKQRLLDREPDRRKVGDRVRRRLLEQILALREGIDRAEHDLIAIRRSLCHAADADRAARAAEIFDDHLLAERLGDFCREDAADNVGAAARPEWNDHGNDMRRPALRERCCGTTDEDNKTGQP